MDHNNLGVALAQLGRVDEALAHYRRAVEIQPDYLEVQESLAGLLALRGSLDEAIAHYQKGARIGVRPKRQGSGRLHSGTNPASPAGCSRGQKAVITVALPARQSIRPGEATRAAWGPGRVRLSRKALAGRMHSNE